MRDLHELPKLRDGLSYLYVEHCKIDQDAKSISFHDAEGKVPVPCASLALLMIGPGTSITHAAIRALAENGCLVIWCGEEGTRFHAQGMGETRSAERLLKQARLCSDSELRLKVVKRLYCMRFTEVLPEDITLQQIRGKEGIRVRETYTKASRETGIPWKGRAYKRDDWNSSDPVNRALSAANACLYGICHAAIVSLGYSPGLGFIHTGKLLSFVYDIADLYKVDITIPAAFRAAAIPGGNFEKEVRVACRNTFKEAKLLERIADDIEKALDVGIDLSKSVEDEEFDEDGAKPGGFWDPAGEVEGGLNYG
ncbi:MAG: type I-E CRISPR-associated endonuclease Cas1e [bacterium]